MTDSLTPRQREVAALVARGWGYKEIGEHLFISAWTARSHVITIANRLGTGGTNPLRTVRDWMQDQQTKGAA
jgi:DNA-binding NarL/FixJ family response regulator